MSCKFYGMHWAGTDFGLVESGGNQCALITTAYSPCRMEIAGQVPDQNTCELVRREMGRPWPELKLIDGGPPELQPRRIVAREADGDGPGERIELACGHRVIVIVGPALENVPCAECVNEFVRKHRVRKDSAPPEDASTHG